MGVLAGMLRNVGIHDVFQLDETLKRYVIDHRWPRWVARELKEPLADPDPGRGPGSRGPGAVGRLARPDQGEQSE